MTCPVEELHEPASRCAKRLRESETVLLASHIDADGLTSAAIASIALRRASIPFDAVFFEQLDAAAVERIASAEYGTVLFTDFGSGQLDVIMEWAETSGFTPIIADHHQPVDRDLGVEYHLNPLLAGIDGAAELSGAGTTYALARALELEDDDRDNRDLAGLAVVGAVGDMQASGGELIGANRTIVGEGAEVGVVEATTDLAMYGTQTRPLPKLLEYASDVRIPGISNDSGGAVRFLTELDLELKDGNEWRRWVDLTADERRTVTSALVRRAIDRGVPPSKIEGLVGTKYTLPNEEPGTELRDASEFSTLLNATARYARADVGLAVCLGNRDMALAAARRLLRNHRRNLSNGLTWVRRVGVTEEANLQWFHARDRIPDTIVGIVAGMAMGTGGIDRRVPIIAFAEKSDSEVKVSARGTHALVRRGLDLSQVMGNAAAAVDGNGGGHNVAAGATVPKGRESEFIEHANRIIGEQLGNES